MATLKQTLKMLNDDLRQTGAGALPLLTSSSSLGESTAVEPDDKIIAEHLNPDTVVNETTALYEKLGSSQESAAIVVNLLGAVAGHTGTGAGGPR